MKYELAKQLKDAGFKVDGIEKNWDCVGDEPRNVGGCYIPTLEELIKACVDHKNNHDQDFHLEHFNGEYGASFCWKHRYDEWELGDTPLDAVAKLWLGLNDKL